MPPEWQLNLANTGFQLSNPQHTFKQLAEYFTSKETVNKTWPQLNLHRNQYAQRSIVGRFGHMRAYIYLVDKREAADANEELADASELEQFHAVCEKLIQHCLLMMGQRALNLHLR